METVKEFLCRRTNGAIHTESAGDFVLPDYNTDVKRVLLTKAVPCDTGCFVNGDSVDVAGIISYEVVYVDSDGELTSCCFSTEYEASVKCNTEANEGCEAVTRISGYSVRLVGPRKFSVKAQLVTTLNLTERETLAVGGNTFALGEPEVKTSSVNVAYRTYATPLEKEYKEVITSIEGVIADDITVLYSDVIPEVNASLVDGAVEISGVLHVILFAKREDEIPSVITSDIAINESLPIECPDMGAEPTAHVCVNNIRINTEPTEDGVSIIAQFNADCCASAVMNSELSVILDCYLTDRDVENTYESFSYTEYLGSARVGEEISLSPTKAELGIDSIREMLITNATIRPDELSLTPTGAKISGVIRFSGVACQINEDGMLGYVPVKYDSPFALNVNLGCHISPDSRFSFVGGVCSASALSTPDGIEFSAKICGNIEAYNTSVITRLSSSVANGEELVKRDSVITVYYPASGETLFDVGRKFHARPLDIAADNELTEEVFASDTSDLRALGVTKLILR